MVDVTLSPTTPVTGGAIVTTANPLPVSVVSMTPVAWASLPAAASVSGVQRRVSNANNALVYSDGTRWRPENGVAVVKTAGTSAAIPNSETIVMQFLVPAGMWQVGDIMRFSTGIDKSGSTDSLNLGCRIGTLGTTGDTQIFSLGELAAANLQSGSIWDLRLDSATSVQRLPKTAATLGYVGVSNGAMAAGVTITDASANALYVSVTVVSSGASNTVRLISGTMEWRAASL